jgi:hypothetical protein
MSFNVRSSAVFGTVLAALCFALWRATRKAKNSARGSEPPEINRGALDRKPGTSAVIEDVSQPVEPSSATSPEFQSEETERQTVFDVDEGSPPYSPSEKIGILVAERQMAAAEKADGVAVPPTGGRDSSPVPFADMAGTIAAGHPEPSGWVTVFPILESTSLGSGFVSGLLRTDWPH